MSTTFSMCTRHIVKRDVHGLLKQLPIVASMLAAAFPAGFGAHTCCSAETQHHMMHGMKNVLIKCKAKGNKLKGRCKLPVCSKRSCHAQGAILSRGWVSVFL